MVGEIYKKSSDSARRWKWVILTARHFRVGTACARIAYTGVCGNAPNMHEFPGRIVCDPRSRSEIAVPVFDEKSVVVAVLDVDSDEYGSFDEKDREWLEEIAKPLTS